MTTTDDPIWSLDPEDLAVRFGFNDGDYPRHVWPLEFRDEIPKDIGWHPVLFEIVKRHVLPTIAVPDGYELRFVGTAHNPARLKDEEGDEPWSLDYWPHMVPVKLSDARVILKELIADVHPD